ncbi:MAG: DNA integrity scanning protein DisA nucleotide-binding domain protein [Acidimicrobiales bacterium]
MTGRLRRLTEELDEIDPTILAVATSAPALVGELSYALRPPVHERRVPSFGAIVEPLSSLDSWGEVAGFGVGSRRVEDLRDATVRRFADGITSWVVRTDDGINDLVVFDRSVGSERDLTVLADATGAALVQRHPNGTVRAVGAFGVLRFDGIEWHLEPPVKRWLDLTSCPLGSLDRRVFDHLLRFAVHDVAARGVGALFVVSTGGRLLPSAERRYGTPPEFSIERPADLAPLYHVLGQLDGASVFDERGILRQLGVRLVPSSTAERSVDAYRGTRHTSALRYSFDDREATVIVVSEDGPVSVLRGGERLGSSA